MINQQLLDYIGQQLQQGMSREQIKSSLVANGWKTQDIDEGFNAINVSVPSTQYSNFSVREQTRIWKIISVVIIGIILVGGGAYFVFQYFFQPTEKPAEMIQLDLNIITPKDTYRVGEEFIDGKYLLSYNGEPFQAIILYTKSRKGFEDEPVSKAAGAIMPGGFDSNPMLRDALQAFKIDESGFALGGDYFEDAGEYTFTMSVYKCSDMGLDDKDCSTDTPTEFIFKFQPLATISKTILVTNGAPEKAVLPTIEQEITDGTVLDCIGVEDPECAVRFLDSFMQNLQLCEASKGTTGIGWEPIMFSMFRGYEILGIQNNLCVINFWFLKTEDIPVTFLNKQMTCKYIASERTIEKVASLENCTGPLVDEINRFFAQYQPISY